MLYENLTNDSDYDYNNSNNNITSKNRRKCTSNEIDGLFTIIFLYVLLSIGIYFIFFY